MFGPGVMFRRFQDQRFFEGEGGGNGGTDDAIKKATFERDSAIAAQKKLQGDLDEIKKKLPTQDQLDHWAELDKQAELVEEDRKKKAGEFDQWRTQIAEKHTNALKAKDKEIDDARAAGTKLESELRQTLIGRAFADATALFGGSDAKTVLTPSIAAAAFAPYVDVAIDEATGARSVVVKDKTGTVMLDTKTGKPAEFTAALADIIESHPEKTSILRGSGKVGSGSAGGGHGGANDDLDPSKLTAEQRRDPKVQAKLRAMQGTGGIQFGSAYDG